MSFKSSTAGATSGAGTAYPSGASEFTSGCLCHSIFNFLCSVLSTILFLSVFFLLAIALSVLRFMAFDYSFCIFKFVYTLWTYFSILYFVIDSLVSLWLYNVMARSSPSVCRQNGFHAITEVLVDRSFWMLNTMILDIE